jgi:hypothetical protein
MVRPETSTDAVLLREWLHFNTLQGADSFVLFSHAPAGATAPSHRLLLHTVRRFQTELARAGARTASVNVEVLLWPPRQARTQPDERFVDAADRQAYLAQLQVLRRPHQLPQLTLVAGLPPASPAHTHSRGSHRVTVCGVLDAELPPPHRATTPNCFTSYGCFPQDILHLP